MPRRRDGDLTADERKAALDAAQSPRQRAAQQANQGDAEGHLEERAPAGDGRRRKNAHPTN